MLADWWTKERPLLATLVYTLMFGVVVGSAGMLLAAFYLEVMYRAPALFLGIPLISLVAGYLFLRPRVYALTALTAAFGRESQGTHCYTTSATYEAIWGRHGGVWVYLFHFGWWWAALLFAGSICSLRLASLAGAAQDTWLVTASLAGAGFLSLLILRPSSAMKSLLRELGGLVSDPEDDAALASAREALTHYMDRKHSA